MAKEREVKRIPKLKIRKQVISENLLYTIIWLIVLLVPFMNAGLMSEDIDSQYIQPAFQSWLKILPFYVLFLLNNHIFYRFLLKKRHYVPYSFLVVLLIVVIFSALEFYERNPELGFTWPFGNIEDTTRHHISMTVFPWWGNMIAAAMMLAANNVLRHMYSSMQADEDSERLQRQNIQAEMYYLKHQINPHFFMNTLNNIHALIDIDSEAAKDTVIELSKMMRYVLYDSEQDSISLEKEIQFLQHYIQLMRLRYSDSVEIVVDVPESSPSQVKIPPLIFIVFVENAFKHGISYNSRSYIHISIEVSAEGDRVHYTVSNSKNPSKWKTHGGIGLDNVRKRLDLLFPKRYQLEIEDTAHHYSVELNIPAL